MIRLLTFTTLFPNSTQPNHGIFVENRLRHLVATREVTADVLAPVAWFPGRAMPHVAAEEQRRGLRVLHPKWLSVPLVGMRAAPRLLAMASARALRHLLANGAAYDAIDAHYFYPDGVAATWLGRRFGLPVVITARGSDVTQFPDYAGPRRLILQAAHDAAAIITVSAGLRDALVGLGAPEPSITVLRNGVDLQVFYPQERARARRAIGLPDDARILASVGALIPRKGHDRTIAALAALPGWQLLIAGAGPERDRLASQAARLGVADRLRLLGALPHTQLPALYSAADLSVLSSSREGWANVLLESMACGTPVIASRIPGNPEVVQSRAAGLITRDNTPNGIVEAVRNWENDMIDRAATRSYAETFGWEATSVGQLAIFRQLVANPSKSDRYPKNPSPALAGEGGAQPQRGWKGEGGPARSV